MSILKSKKIDTNVIIVINLLENCETIDMLMITDKC